MGVFGDFLIVGFDGEHGAAVWDIEAVARAAERGDPVCY
jgi:hypothetical protein